MSERHPGRRARWGDVDLGPAFLHAYDCTRCGERHFSDEALFREHYGAQDANGVNAYSAALVADGRAAYAHDREGAA